MSDRQQEMRARLLDAAAEILEQEGLLALNTNRVAEVAGVTPPTVYRHFKDKVAILRSRLERYLEEEACWLAALGPFDQAPTPRSAERWIRALVMGYFDHARSFKGIVALRQAARSFPELEELDQRSIEATAQQLAHSLALSPKLLRTEALAVSRCLAETCCSAMDRCHGAQPRQSKVRLEQLVQMLTAYLKATLR